MCEGISDYEREVQELVTSARTTGATETRFGAGEVGEEINRGASLVGGLFALSENYPDLSADENYASFMKELVDTEDRIALARAFYNDSLLLRDRLLTYPGRFGCQMVPLQVRKNLTLLPEPEIAQVPRVSL